ncbi:hypothetical protein QB910_000131 [Dabrowskivirus KKP3916]|uniref:Uncharacterized protein n=1 Tax=Alicyclobacillus phage KKP_3916 TaxID=3040651 RepID=A0AAT9V7V5_9CAUD|nr:hypothetical protein QB910_000131 [Alicyclobacillus phage KKP 3916]
MKLNEALQMAQRLSSSGDFDGDVVLVVQDVESVRQGKKSLLDCYLVCGVDDIPEFGIVVEHFSIRR